MSKRYYATVDAYTGETSMPNVEWKTIAPEIQEKTSLIYKGFDSKEEAEHFINRGYIEENTIDHQDSEAIDKEIEDRISSLSDDEAIIITDGSYNDTINKDIVGAGLIEFSKDNKEGKIYSVPGKNIENTKNVTGEILAVKKGIEWALNNQINRLDIYFDYIELVSWAYGHQPNYDISRDYYKLIENTNKRMKLVFHKVSADINAKYNKEAHRLAKDAVENYGK